MVGGAASAWAATTVPLGRMTSPPPGVLVLVAGAGALVSVGGTKTVGGGVMPGAEVGGATVATTGGGVTVLALRVSTPPGVRATSVCWALVLTAFRERHDLETRHGGAQRRNGGCVLLARKVERKHQRVGPE